MAKRKTLGQLRRKMDRLWSLMVLQKGKCEVCGSQDHLQAHHIVGRRNQSLRHAVINGLCLCPLHHRLGIQSMHQDPVWGYEWLVKNKAPALHYISEHKGDDPWSREFLEIFIRDNKGMLSK